MNIKKTAVILLHAFVGWALCGATMSIGMAATSLRNALLIHEALNTKRSPPRDASG